MCDKKDWREFNSFKLCLVHHLKFSNSSICPNKDTLPLSLHMENSISKKEVSKSFTSNSQVITSNSQGVHDLSIACGSPNKFQSKRRYVKKYRDSIVERFHNYGVRFDAVVDWSALFMFEEVCLRNNVKYKRIDLPIALVRVFRKSILVTLRSSSEVKGLDVRSAEVTAQKLISDALVLLPKSIIVSRNLDVTSTHNAFINHPIAKRDVNISIDGERRFISDNSKGYSEFEAISPVFAVSDSVKIEDDIRDLVSKGYSRDFIVNSIGALIEDRQYHAENIRSHIIAIREMAFMLKRLNRRNKLL